ncbi:MAG: hypothetical protein KC592_18265 [Nitrospira sp.]|nr:hypothetical protein [Nitrospira sp.]
MATTTGSVAILGASLVVGIVWWKGIQSDLSPQAEIHQNQNWPLNSIWTEAALGVAMLLLAFLTFSIRAQLLIF